MLGCKPILEHYLHFFFLFIIILFLIRWIHTEGHLQAFFRAVKHNVIGKLHCLLDYWFATKKHTSCFSVTAVGT